MSPESLPAGDHGPGVRLPRLRQRRLDGHLHGQQRRQRLLHSRKAPLKNALYKNNRDGTFTDVTEKAGVAGGTQFGMGCAIADYDNDGYRRHLRHRLRPAARSTTTTATARSPTSPTRPACAAPGWTTSAVWFDYDNDGRLDLFLCSFVEFSLTNNVVLRRQQAGQALLLHPARLQADAQPALPQQRRRHVHRGERGDRHPARARQGPGRRRDRHQQRRPDGPVRRQRHRAELPLRQPRQGASGKRSRSRRRSASAPTGTPRSGMGVDAADFNGDGRQDLFVANVDQEMFSLYRNDGQRDLLRRRALQRRGQATRLLSGWGLKFFDYDNDGFVDLFLANGHPDDMIENYSQQVRYKEPLLLFHQRRDEAVERQRRRRAGLREDVPRPRPGGRRLQQRRPHRRPDRQQRRRAGAAQEQRRARATTGWA